MGFLDKFTGNTPQVRQAVEETKTRLKAEGDAISSRIKAESQAAREDMSRKHAVRMEPLNKEIANLKQGMEDNRKSMYIESAFSRFDAGITTALSMALMRGDVSDPRSAIEDLRIEVGQKINEFKGNPSEQGLSGFESWALSKAGERHAERVTKEFKDLRERLHVQGIVFE